MYNTMRRSLLARCHPHLRPALLHGCSGGSMAVLGGTNPAMTSRGYRPNPKPAAAEADKDGDTTPAASWHHCGWCGHPNRVAPSPQRRHLYVAVDDWSNGFSLHKLDLDDVDTDVHGDLAGSEQLPPAADQRRRLPPPAVRLELPMAQLGTRFAALGSRIVACNEDMDGGVTVVYDTGTAAVATVHPSPDVLHRGWEHAVAAGDNKLYAFVSKFCKPDPYDNAYYCNSGLDSDDDDSGDSEMYLLDGTKWSWSRHPSPLPFRIDGSYRIRAYAVHPGGKLIFMSVSANADDRPRAAAALARKAGTYSYNVESGAWTRHGAWMLPFAGQGHYDGELGAWVGGEWGYRRGACRIGCCDVLSPDARVPPGWKLCEESVSSAPVRTTSPPPSSGPEEPIEAALVGMGGGGRFCLVETAPREGLKHTECWGDGDKCELRVSTFRARYGKDGELTTTARRLACSYALSMYRAGAFHLHAFWM
ncbi:hypothetical protein ACP70R_048497 [Stipagrostis hirtigluma subsp. patula]